MFEISLQKFLMCSEWEDQILQPEKHNDGLFLHRATLAIHPN